jgi:hypothetical protein
VAPRTTLRRPRGPGSDRAARAALRSERLASLTLSLRGARTAEDVMSVLVLEAERSFGASSAVAYGLEGATLELIAALGRAEDANEWLRSVPVTAQIPVARAIRDGQPGWYVSRAALAEAFPGWAERVPHAERFGALAALPLRRGHATLGAVGFAFDQERAFAPAERRALLAAAAEGALALTRVRAPDEEGAPAASPSPERP